MQDQSCIEEFEEHYNAPKSPEDSQFDHIIMEMQQIVIQGHFEDRISGFMNQHWGSLENGDGNVQMELFGEYRQTIQQYIQAHIIATVPYFNWQHFNALFAPRKHLVDEQLLDLLLSLQDLQHFKEFTKDYRSACEDVQIFKTIKTNKMPEQKKVKGKDNIFSGSGDNSGMFQKGLKPGLGKKKSGVEKKEEELLVPELILTVKPMRKG